ncbi:protein FANTASTIC FOUR 3-like [Amaranthus tricolor]|uniref:protein FANTASTIC FOUR 3-like n=1 Tax=Amaranthus tricolor TaxID=29722 RepID=UPI0025839098|nr:protein FANTASTIC FOUR 3-like [Amaranthus tricolor]
MAACGSLRHIFENTIPEKNSSSSSLIDSLLKKPIKPLKTPIDHSLTEIFGELHFKENNTTAQTECEPVQPASVSAFFTPPLTASSGSTALPIESIYENGNQEEEKSEGIISALFTNTNNDGYSKTYHRRSESLQFCTEGLGSESLYDGDDLMTEKDSSLMNDREEKVHVRRHSGDSYSYSRNIRGGEKAMFPPPISYIGQTGKPSVSFQSYRQNGRFVLKEVRIPTQECLQAKREDGRLRLSFVQTEDEDEDEDKGDDEEKDEEERELSGCGSIEEGEEEDE